MNRLAPDYNAGEGVNRLLKQRQSTPDKTFGQKAKEFGVGFAKGAGRSLVNLAETANDFMPPIGISGVGGFKPNLTSIKEKLEPKTQTEKVGGYAETGVELLAPLPGGKQLVGESLINRARKLYQSALKPSTTLSGTERLKVIDTGLKEGITLTRGGIEKTANLIEDLESQLGKGIDKAAGIIRNGKGEIVSRTGEIAKIPLSFIKPYIDDVKKFFENTADVAYSQKSIQKLDRMYEDLVKKYGDNIDVDVAQEVKTNTYRLLKNHYDKLSAPAIEGSKQIARGMKEGIVKVAPIVEDINKRLGDLYNFEHQLERAGGRVGNLNVISLGSKVLATAGGKVGAGLAIANELFGNAVVKSWSAVKINKIGQFLATKSDKEIKVLKDIAKAMGPVNLNNLIQGFADTLRGE